MLELRDLHKRYGSTTALDGVDLTAATGRLLGFLGPNGAGKTTTMRSVFGLVDLDAGTTLWDGAPIDDDVRRRFGYMPEQRGVYPKMRVGEQVAYFAELHGCSRAEAQEAAERWLTEFGLADRVDDRVDTLSHGNQQRVQLAIALAHDPDLLVLDEPFSGLDPVGVERMKAIVRTAAQRGTAVVFSSHQLDLVEDVCDDVIVVRDGRVVLSGTLDEVRDVDPRRQLTVGFTDPSVCWDPSARDLPPDVQVLAAVPGRTELLAPPDVDLDAVLLAARRAGGLARFAFEPQPLSQIFLEAVRR